MTEQREGRVRRRLYLTLIFLLSTHKGQYTLCLKMTHPLSAITWTNIVRVLTSSARDDTICPRPSPPLWAAQRLTRRRADAT